MVQQQLPGLDPWVKRWQHMVAVIMLNQTNRKSVKKVFPEFIERWSVPALFLMADHDAVKQIIQPLGMVNIRYQRLRKMSQDYLTWNGENAMLLYGIGKYGSDSYEIFFKQNYNIEPTDKELKRYIDEEVIR